MRITGSNNSSGMSLGPKVGLVEIEGIIYDSKEAVNKLERLRKRDDINAIVIRVDSPGGTVAPTQEIYTKVKKVNEEKPVIISVGTVAASGGYYVALGGRKILVNPGSIIGSIGVRFDYPVATELMEKIGLQYQTFKSGDLKDAGSPTREVTDKDREFFESVIKDIQSQFVQALTENRNIDLNELEMITDGRIFTGLQSVELSLVDSIGTLEDAVSLAGVLGGIEGTPKLFEFEKKRPRLIDAIWGDIENKLNTKMQNLSAPLYLWRWE